MNGFIGLNDSQLITVKRLGGTKRILEFYTVQIPGGDSQLFKTWDASKITDYDVDPDGEWIAYGQNDDIYLNRLRDFRTGQTHLFGKHRGVKWVSFNSTGDRLATTGKLGEIHLWRLAEGVGTLERTLQGKIPDTYLIADLDKTGLLVAASEGGRHSTTELGFIWDLTGPPDSAPITLRADIPWVNNLSIHPDGQWLISANAENAMLWSLHHKYSHNLQGQSPPAISVAFTPDGKQLVSCSDDGTVRVWPLAGSGEEKSRMIMEEKNTPLGGLNIDPAGKNVLVTARFDWRALLIPLAGGSPHILPFPPRPSEFHFTGPAAFTTDGRIAAVALFPPASIRVWNLESYQYFDIDTRIGQDDCGWGKQFGAIDDMKFLPDGQLITTGTIGIHVWDLDKRTSKMIRPCKKDGITTMTLNNDGSRALLVDGPIGQAGQKTSTLSILDLHESRYSEIGSHGRGITAVAMDDTGRIAVTGDSEGVVKVGPITNEQPHLLFGHRQRITSIAVSPNGQWIASGSDDGTIRMWPMPRGKPFHLLPYNELMDRLRAMTNLRVIPDSQAETGYKIEPGPFPGWEKVPSW